MIRTTLKELQEVRVIIDRAIKDTQELNLSKRVYELSMHHLTLMRHRNNVYQREAIEALKQEAKGVRK